jgi:hypothetical protein
MTENFPNDRYIKTGERVIGEERRERSKDGEVDIRAFLGLGKFVKRTLFAK